jgi:hypothetical protein
MICGVYHRVRVPYNGLVMQQAVPPSKKRWTPKPKQAGETSNFKGWTWTHGFRLKGRASWSKSHLPIQGLDLIPGSKETECMRDEVDARG